MAKNIQINQPLALNEIGRRSNNEDAIYPKRGEASAGDRLFLVCDGVGGSNKGEVASALICNHFPKYLNEALVKGQQITHDLILEATKYVYQKFIQHLNDHPECEGMASTFTMVLFHRNTCLVAWAGDSRIYQFRNGEILFKSRDHSVVADLIESHQITEEEARVHPMRNRITRAFSGEEYVEPDIVSLHDITPGDVFLLCSDGVLEQVDDPFLSDLSIQHPRTMVEKINDVASIHSQDNFSLYLMQLNELGEEIVSEPMDRNISPGSKILHAIRNWFKGI